jgi:hypothetical protein
MTLTERKAFSEGRELWYQYIDVNGYSFEPSDSGLKSLSRKTGIKQAVIRRKIHTFLSN